MPEANSSPAPTFEVGMTGDSTTMVLPSFTSYQKFVIAILALLQFTIVLDFMIISPLGDLLMKSLALTPSQFGSVVSAYAISAGISGILTAGFADKFDRKKLLLFFYTGFILGTVICGLVNTYHTMLIARIVTGLFGGVVGSILMAIVTDVFALHQRGRVIGFIQMSFAGSQILGVPAGILLANAWGWHSTFFMVAGLAVLIGTAIVIRLQPIAGHLKLQHDKNALEHLWHTVQKKDYRAGFLATAMLSMGGFMLMPFTSAFLVNNVKIAQEQLPLLFFCTGISSMIIMPVIGRLSDRINKLKLFAVGSTIASVMILIYSNLGASPLWLVIIINMILFMGIMSRMVPAMALNSAVPDAHDRGAFMSVNSSLQQMAGGFAAMFAGIVIVQDTPTSPLEHFNWLGILMVGFMAWCVYLVYRVKKIVDRKTGGQA
jgi:predicted MFS family arabinose efflux permease